MNTRTRLSLHRMKSGGLLAVLRRTTQQGHRVDLLRLPAGTTLRSALERLAQRVDE